MSATDPNRPNAFIPPRDDRVNYRDPRMNSGAFDSKMGPVVPGQELFDQYNQDYIPIHKSNLDESSYFYLHVSGQLEFAVFPDCDCLMVKYSIIAGKEWEKTEGELTGTSQFSYKSRSSSKKIIWNFPFNVSFRSTCPKGWPQVTLMLYGPDFLGREIVKGYSTLHVPCQPGRHERTAKTFKPKSASILVEFLGMMKGKVPELVNPPRTLAEAYGREVVRAQSGGNVRIVFNVAEKNLESFGYSIRKY
jgi:B9 domain-containing protein 1